MNDRLKNITRWQFYGNLVERVVKYVEFTFIISLIDIRRKV